MINASLELFNVLLQNSPLQLKLVILNPNGISRSRILCYEHMSKYKMRSPSVLSVATTLMSEADNALESDLRDNTVDIQKWINESKLTVDSMNFAESKELSDTDVSDSVSVNTLTFESNSDCAYSDIPIGMICDNYGTENMKSESVADNLDKLVLSETSSEKSYSQEADEKALSGDVCVKVSKTKSFYNHLAFAIKIYCFL